MFKYEALAQNASYAAWKVLNGWHPRIGISIVKVVETGKQSQIKGHKYYEVFFNKYDKETGELITE